MISQNQEGVRVVVLGPPVPVVPFRHLSDAAPVVHSYRSSERSFSWSTADGKTTQIQLRLIEARVHYRSIDAESAGRESETVQEEWLFLKEARGAIYALWPSQPWVDRIREILEMLARDLHDAGIREERFPIVFDILRGERPGDEVPDDELRKVAKWPLCDFVTSRIGPLIPFDDRGHEQALERLLALMNTVK